VHNVSDFAIGSESGITLTYPATVQIISGSVVIMIDVSGPKELLRLILDLRHGEAVNIALSANREEDHFAPVVENAGEAQHLRYEVDLGLSAVPCIYVRRND